MTSDAFTALLNRRIESMETTLLKKAGEYANRYDRLHNFKRAAGILGTTPEEALVGMMVKHLTSIFDIVDRIPDGCLPTRAMLDEKIGDTINYAVLLEALITERLP